MRETTDVSLAVRTDAVDATAGWPESCVGQLGALCRAFGMDSLRPQLDALAMAAAADGTVDVVVVGRFKAGKGSFLNHVIGLDLLPVAALPVTAVVTRLRGGPGNRAVVRRQNGDEQEIPLGTLARYVTEQQNPRNVERVATVEVELAGLRSLPGIRLVDTPGLGSVFTHNSQTSMEWLPRVGAALLAVSTDQPLSEHDAELLRELAKYTPEISILLTKADLVFDQELAEVADFVRGQAGAILGRPPRVFPYSTRPAYAALRGQVDEFLRQHVSCQHEEKAREIVRHKLATLIGGCREYLRVARSAGSVEQDIRTVLQGQLEEERHDLTSVRNEIRLLRNDLKVRLQQDALEEFVGHHAGLVSWLAGDLREQMGGWKGNLWETTPAYERWAQQVLLDRLGPLSREQGDRLSAQHLAAAQASLGRVVRGFQDRVASNIEQVLHLRFTGAAFAAAVKEPKRPDIDLARVFDTPVQLLWFLIPMSVFRPLVHRHFLRLLPWEAERNLRRLAAQWSQASGDSIDDLARQAQAFIEDELNTIDGLVGKTEDQRPAIEQALALLDRLDQEAGAPPDLLPLTPYRHHSQEGPG
jgi:GTP-binding protein EngB required for normal cell division